jgi:hypothetical protein
MADDTPESPQRWTAMRRATLIVSILKGETSALGPAAVSRRPARHTQNYLSHLCAQGVVRASAPTNAAAARAGPGQPGGPQQRTMGDGSDPRVLRSGRLGASRRGDRFATTGS